MGIKNMHIAILMSHLISLPLNWFRLSRSDIDCTVNTSLPLVNNSYELFLNASLALEMLLPSTCHSSLIRDGQVIDLLSMWDLNLQIILTVILIKKKKI